MSDFHSMPQRTYELASFGSRLVAFLLDLFILAMIMFVLTLLLGIPLDLDNQTPMLIMEIGLGIAYYGYFWLYQNGQTPGKKAMNIRIIKADGSPLTATDVMLRIFGYYVGRIVIFMGYIWAAMDANNQAWHDKMANTYVVVDAEQKNKTITL